MNALLHTKLEPTTTTILTQSFLTEFNEKHNVDNAVFLIDSSQSLNYDCQSHSPSWNANDTKIGLY